MFHLTCTTLCSERVACGLSEFWARVGRQTCLFNATVNCWDYTAPMADDQSTSTQHGWNYNDGRKALVLGPNPVPVAQWRQKIPQGMEWAHSICSTVRAGKVMAGNLLQKARQSFHCTFAQLTLIRIITNHSQDNVRKHYKAVNFQTQNAQINCG